MPFDLRSSMTSVFLLTLLLTACGGGHEEGAGSPALPANEVAEGVSNEALRVSLTSVPASLRVERNQGSDLVLAPADGRPGRMVVLVSEPDLGGVNLPDAVNAHKAEVEERGGVYRGQIELGGPLGAAYASRGRYPDGEVEMEDFRIFTLHPSGTELLTLRYTYPVPDDTEARRDELFAVLGEIEPATPADEGAMDG